MMAKVRLTVYPNSKKSRIDGERIIMEGETAEAHGSVVEIRQNIGAEKLGGPERMRVTGFPLVSLDSYEIQEI